MANQSMDIITKVLEQSAKLVEEKVDAQLSKLNEMDEDDLERLKERRLEALKKAQKQKQVCGIFSFNCFTVLFYSRLHDLGHLVNAPVTARVTFISQHQHPLQKKTFNISRPLFNRYVSPGLLWGVIIICCIC